jgi:hypothetical protein
MHASTAIGAFSTGLVLLLMRPRRRFTGQLPAPAYFSDSLYDELAPLAGKGKDLVFPEQASNSLNEMEQKVGCGIVRGRPNGSSLTALLKNDNSLLRAEREDGARTASVRDSTVSVSRGSRLH